ncbi:hypothetical protein ABZ499_27745 [Streptomyces sp. NPDC019990]|uniref:hypothetical protein n=1 Tax=Streptomyces sp. NPDC019990 TaxID=3154693 RepID=UPI0033DBF225
MPRQSPTCDDARQDAALINQLIRRLMRKPASRSRTAEWQRLIVLWSEATQQQDVEKAA